MSTIITGTLLRPEGGSAVLEDGWLRIGDDQILEVCEGDCPHTPDIQADLVVPGFVDAHLHLPQFDSIGADGMGLLDWLDRVIFPAEARWEDPDYGAEMTGRVIDQLLSFGTIGFAGYATVHHAATRAALDVCRERNVRAIVGQVLMDMNSPPVMQRNTDRLLNEAERLVHDDWGLRTAASLNPRFALTCTMELMSRVGQIAKATNCFVQTHLAETQPECTRAAELHGKEYTEIYLEAGLTSPRTIFAHGVWLDQRARHVLANTGSIVAHCPGANIFLRSGMMPRETLLDDGIPVVLGSDVAGGWERSMVRVARAMINTAKVLEHRIPSAGEAWWQITRGNAERLGWDCGRIGDGSSADLLLIKPDIRWRDAVDPLGALLYGWDDRWLDGVILDGVLQES